MDKKVYILDRYDDFFGVFLLRTDESQQILIPKKIINVSIQEGDFVEVLKTNEDYEITLLRSETEDAKDKVNSLLDKLRNK